MHSQATCKTGNLSDDNEEKKSHFWNDKTICFSKILI